MKFYDKSFQIDETNSDEKYLYVDVVGLGTVAIHKGDEGVIVDLYGVNPQDSPTTSTWATYDELNGRV